MNEHEYRWTSFAATASGDGAHPGARASRPHHYWHSLGHLLHLARPATAPGLCFGRVHAVAAGRVAGCHIAGKLSGAQRECMRAGRPRSRVGPSGWCGGGTIRPATSPKADELPLASSRMPACPPPAVSRKNPVHPVHRCEWKICPCLPLNRFLNSGRRRLFQVSAAPALPGRSYEEETADCFEDKP